MAGSYNHVVDEDLEKCRATFRIPVGDGYTLACDLYGVDHSNHYDGELDLIWKAGV